MARRTYEYYTQGNTARKMDFDNRAGDYQRGTAAPVRREEENIPDRPLSRRQIKEMEKESNRARYRRMESETMSLKFVVFLSAMVAILLTLSVKYLNYQADISETKSNINSLKSNVEVLNSQNDAIAYDIEAYIDINRIINVATNELGMVMADQSQIKYFEKNVDEFMNQYADVPEE
ncbi:MAG: hypothetical protein SPF70_06780 [Lachnospiraceae bacterium]|nr:hypothetical protein [Lachnospiraceae bacterium]